MKEVKLEIGKYITLKTQYRYNINIVRIPKGYYMVMDKQKFGPYLKVVVEQSSKHGNDIFVACGSLDSTIIYRAGVYGIEVAEIIDTTKQASKIFNKMLDLQPKAKEIEGCMLLGIEKGYAAYVDQNNKFFLAKIDDEIKPVEEYNKFDTYIDMIKYYREKGIKVYNEKIEKLSKDTAFIDVIALESILQNITFEELPKGSKYNINIGYPFSEFDFDSHFMIEILKERGGVKVVKNVHLHNKPEYEKELNNEGYYNIGSTKIANNLNLLKRRNKEIYDKLYDILENRYYQLLAEYPDKNKHCLELVTIIYKNVCGWLEDEFNFFQSDTFNEEEFNSILRKGAQMVQQYSPSVPFGISGRVNSKWLKALNPKIYDDLWERCEHAFNQRKGLKV